MFLEKVEREKKEKGKGRREEMAFRTCLAKEEKGTLRLEDKASACHP